MRSQIVVRHIAKIQKTNPCFLISSLPDTTLSPVAKSITAFLPPQDLDPSFGEHIPLLISKPWDVELRQWNEMHSAIDPNRANMLIAEFHPLLVGCIVEFHIEVETDVVQFNLVP